MDGEVRPAGYPGDALDSGSSPLSTPRRSPELASISPAAPSFRQNNHNHVPGDDNVIRVGANPTSATHAGATAPKQRKPRVPRKPKDESAVSSDNAVKEKKPRKPREPRDPNKPVRKRQKLEPDTATSAIPLQAGQPLQHPLQRAMPPHPAHPSALPAQQQQQQQQQPLNHNHPHLIAPPPPPPTTTIPPRSHPHDPVRDSVQHAPAAGIPPLPVYHRTPAPAPRPTSSGQMYDPIRSSTADKIIPLPNYHQSPSTSPSQHAYLAHARASPSIASLIDPPAFDNPSPNQSPSRALLSRPANPTDTNHYSTSGASTMQRTVSATSAPHQPALTSALATAPTRADAMDVDSKPLTNGNHVSSEPAAAPTPPPPAPPKPPRARPKSPPLPLGSGLLSSALFNGSDAPPKKYDEVPNQCIVIDVPMVPGKVNFVNFIREVENKYGFDVAHPRLAEHRRRMRQMAAAGAALESGSGDDMGVDISADEDSNTEMGGADNHNDSAAPAAGNGKKKRRPKGNEYDKSDDFIDDTELLWEEQALASKDGYFVWSGPLARDGEKQTIERADGTVRRGRGGRGRGGSTRGGGASGEGSTRGRTTGGRGSRGGAVRRPRGAKAAAARELERERAEKERAASANLTNGAVTNAATVSVTVA